MTDKNASENGGQGTEAPVLVKRKRRGLVSHAAHTGGRIISAILTVILMISMAAVLRIAEGGLDFTPVKPYLDRELARYGYGDKIGFDDLVLEWDDVQNDLDLFARNVRITGDLVGQDNTRLIIIPSVEIGIDLAAILQGRFRLKELVFSDLYVSLLRDETGRLDFDVGLSADSPGFTPQSSYDQQDDKTGHEAAVAALQSMLDQWALTRDSDNFLSRLERIAVSNAILTLRDQALDRQYRATRLDINATRFTDHIVLAANSVLDVPLQGESLARPRLTARLDYLSDRSFDFSAGLDRLHTAQLAALLPDIADIRDIDIQLSATTETTIAADGQIGPVDFQVLAENGLLTREDLFPKPLTIKTLVMQGNGNIDSRDIALDRFALETDLPVLTGKANLRQSDAGFHLQAEAELSALPVDRLMDYWPVPAAKNARKWVAEHIVDGRATGASVKLDLGPEVLSGQTKGLPEGALDFRFGYEDLVLQLFDNFPPITGIRGESITDHKDMRYGIEAATGNDLVIDKGLVTIVDIFAAEDPIMEVDFSARGAATKALEIINTPPLDLISDFGLEPSKIKGQAQTNVVISFPLIKALALKDIEIKTRSVIADAFWPDAVAGFSVSEGQLELVADNDHFMLTGETLVNDVAARVEWENKFGDAIPIRQKLNLYTELSPADFEGFGIPLLPGLDGLVGVSLALFQDQEQTWSVLSTSDFTRASLGLPELGWQKQPGEPARITTKTELTPNVPIIVTMAEADLGAVKANAELLVEAESRDLHQARITGFEFGETRADITIGKQDDGGWLGIFRGEQLDLRPILEWYNAKADEEEETGEAAAEPDLPPLEAKIRTDRLIVTDNITVQDFRADGAYIDTRLAQLSARGTVADQGVVVSVKPVDGGRDFNMTLRDAGEMLSFLTDNQNIDGGTLVAKGFVNDATQDTDITGTLEITDFRVVKAPVLARLLNVATLLGIAAELQGQGIPFARLEAPFTYKDKLLTIENARASGNSLGLTFRGRMDNNQDLVDFDGALIPAYALNRVFGAIPLLGKILGGANEEGLLAVSYRIHGDKNDPAITVNPLSVLAPGLLRDVFSSVLKGVQGGGIKDPDAPEIDPLTFPDDNDD